MRYEEETMIYPPVEELLERTDSKFRLVTLAALRARQINAYFEQLGEGIGAMVKPQVHTETVKPLSIAFAEIAADKIVAVDPSEQDPMADFGDLEPGLEELAQLEAEEAEVLTEQADSDLDSAS